MEGTALGDQRPRLVVLSHVLPFPGTSGQQQRVFYTLKALRDHFYVTFATSVAPGRAARVRHELSALCDEVVLLPSRYARSLFTRVWHRVAGAFYTLLTGLKFSNYLVGRVEFAPRRLADALKPWVFDGALFEYWHAAESTSVFQREGIPCVLDMHNILWQAYARQFDARPYLPRVWKRRALAQYQRREEDAWAQFDALIAINAAERDYTRATVPEPIPVFYAPMGIDLALWPYTWQPAQPPRIAYYGGLGSSHNQQDALSCYKHVMPAVWRAYPDAELWVIGSNPPASLHRLAERDARVRVTGFVECVQEVLQTISVVVCPWSGTYGFRSRLVEVMALGVPVITSPEAVDGMGMKVGRGIFLEKAFPRMAEACLRLLEDPVFARQQSEAARAQVEEKFSYEATYDRLARELFNFVVQRQQAKVC